MVHLKEIACCSHDFAHMGMRANEDALESDQPTVSSFPVRKVVWNDQTLCPVKAPMRGVHLRRSNHYPPLTFQVERRVL